MQASTVYQAALVEASSAKGKLNRALKLLSELHPIADVKKTVCKPN